MSLLLIAAVAVSWKGTFCVIRDGHAGECRETSTAAVSVTPENRARPFVWRSGGHVRLGVIPENAAGIDLSGMKIGTIAVQVIAPDSMKPLLTIDGAEVRWPVENAIGRIMIDVPPANRYALSLQGDNVEPLHRDRVRVDAGATTDVGPLSLRRYPSISGVVIRRQGGDPLPGALIQDANGKLLAKSDDRGVFRFPRKDEGLQSIRVAAVGYATHVVPLGTVTVDRELPPVALGTGVALTIRVHFAEHHGVLPAVKEARLLQISDSGSPPILMAQHEMEERRVVFDGIEPGTYAVELAGMEALEKLVVPVEVDDSKTIDVKIDPLDITITAFLGNVAQANTVVELAALRNLWRATINTGRSLSYTGPLWQRGLIAATVRLAGSEFRTSRVIGSNDLGEWNIIVPDRKLTGTVRDEESGQPIPGTYIQYDFEGSDEWVRGAHLDIDQNGRFQLFGAREGTYIIRVTAPGHVVPDPVRVSIDENTSEPHVDIALKRQATRDVILVDAATGERIAGAPVIELLPDGRSIARMLTTDGSGMVSVGLPGKQAMTLYVLPAAGSLKVVHLFDTPDNEPMRVEVPPPASSIELKAQFDDGTPFQGCRVLMRFNGETIPPVIMELFASIHHVAVVSGSGGEMSLPAMPSGLYEFWPYLASSSIPVPTSAPIRANIEAGQSSIVLTFDRQHG